MPPPRPPHRPPPRGAVIPLVLVLITVLLGAAALSLDLGRMRSTATEVQDVADASALAAISASQLYPDSDSRVGPPRARTIAARNRAAGLPGAVATADIVPAWYSQSAGTTTLRDYFSTVNAVVVTARATPKYALAGALGWARPTVARSATAWIGNMQGAACVRPLAVPYTRIYEDINGLTSKPYSSQQNPLAYAPTLTQAQVARYGQLSVTNRTFVTLPPWQDEADWDAKGQPNSGSWHTADYSGVADWAAYEAYISPPAGSPACAVATTDVGSYLHPFVWNVCRDTGMAPVTTSKCSTINTNGILDHNRRGFLTLCNQYGGGDTTNHSATCRNADGTVGVSTRVAFTDSIPEKSGKNFSQRVRMISQARIMCYFVYLTDRCPATLISNGAGGQVSWSMPAGIVCTPNSTSCTYQTIDKGYPRGTLVVLIDAPVFGDITPDVTLGDSLSLTQRLVLVK